MSKSDFLSRLKGRIEERNDAEAINHLAWGYQLGRYELTPNGLNAVDLYIRSGKLGCAHSYFTLGDAYENGKLGLAVDMEKAVYYYKLGAVAGEHRARYSLGRLEGNAGNGKTAVKHFMISACIGDDDSLNAMRISHASGDATKDDVLTPKQRMQ